MNPGEAMVIRSSHRQSFCQTLCAIVVSLSPRSSHWWLSLEGDSAPESLARVVMYFVGNDDTLGPSCVMMSHLGGTLLNPSKDSSS